MWSTRGEIERVLRTACSVAIVGLGDSPERPIHDVATFLLDEGLTVYPVHPRATAVLGLPVLRSIGQLPTGTSVDVAVLAVRPAVGDEVVGEIVADGRIGNVWFQPGAEQRSTLEKARARGLTVVAGHCMMAEYKRLLDG